MRQRVHLFTANVLDNDTNTGEKDVMKIVGRSLSVYECIRLAKTRSRAFSRSDLRAAQDKEDKMFRDSMNRLVKVPDDRRVPGSRTSARISRVNSVINDEISAAMREQYQGTWCT
jgi:hypothetical protein